MSGGEKTIFGVQETLVGRVTSTEIVRYCVNESDAVAFFKKMCLDAYHLSGVKDGISWETNRSPRVCNRATFSVRSDDATVSTPLYREYQVIRITLHL